MGGKALKGFSTKKWGKKSADIGVRTQCYSSCLWHLYETFQNLVLQDLQPALLYSRDVPKRHHSWTGLQFPCNSFYSVYIYLVYHFFQ